MDVAPVVRTADRTFKGSITVPNAHASPPVTPSLGTAITSNKIVVAVMMVAMVALPRPIGLPQMAPPA